jgi:hypothetical protein
MRNSQLDKRVTRLMMHLRDQHGMHIVPCAQCEGTGCPDCDFNGILGIDFDTGKDDVCGPDCPANELFRRGLN